MNSPKGAKSELGKSIRRLRKMRDMTQRELADAAGLTESALRSYELGDRTPKPDTLSAVANALDVPLEAFDIYGIASEAELLHALFLLEDKEDFQIQPTEDGGIYFAGSEMQKAVQEWYEICRCLQNDEITEQEYEKWKVNYRLPSIEREGKTI